MFMYPICDLLRALARGLEMLNLSGVLTPEFNSVCIIIRTKVQIFCIIPRAKARGYAAKPTAH